jgi:UDP-glucose 4-epimerase
MPFSLRAPRRYLVTGGCGFIGSHLTDALIHAGHEVVILDNLSTGKRENANPKAEVIIGDAADYETVWKAMEDVDGCFHLAAVASVEKSVIDWAKTHTVNQTASVNVFQAASRHAKKIPVVYTSSAAVYGDCPNTPISEDEPTMPLTAYGADKLGCDLHGRIAWLVHGVPTIGLRPFNVYGPRQDPSSPYSGVISIFADRISRGQPIRIYGDGEQVRDFVYVADAVKVFFTAMQQMREGHEVINICTGRSTSINALADALEAAAGWKVERQYLLPRKGDIRISVGNPAKLASRLGLTLNTRLQDGVRVLVDNRMKEAV